MATPTPGSQLYAITQQQVARYFAQIFLNQGADSSLVETYVANINSKGVGLTDQYATDQLKLLAEKTGIPLTRIAPLAMASLPSTTPTPVNTSGYSCPTNWAQIPSDPLNGLCMVTCGQNATSATTVDGYAYSYGPKSPYGSPVASTFPDSDSFCRMPVADRVNKIASMKPNDTTVMLNCSYDSNMKYQCKVAEKPMPTTAPLNTPYSTQLGACSKGRYDSPEVGAIRLYTKAECTDINGMWYQNGECIKKTGGSYSWDCRKQMSPPTTTPFTTPMPMPMPTPYSTPSTPITIPSSVDIITMIGSPTVLPFAIAQMDIIKDRLNDAFIKMNKQPDTDPAIAYTMKQMYELKNKKEIYDIQFAEQQQPFQTSRKGRDVTLQEYVLLFFYISLAIFTLSMMSYAFLQGEEPFTAGFYALCMGVGFALVFTMLIMRYG